MIGLCKNLLEKVSHFIRPNGLRAIPVLGSSNSASSLQHYWRWIRRRDLGRKQHGGSYGLFEAAKRRLTNPIRRMMLMIANWVIALALPQLYPLRSYNHRFGWVRLAKSTRCVPRRSGPTRNIP